MIENHTQYNVTKKLIDKFENTIEERKRIHEHMQNDIALVEAEIAAMESMVDTLTGEVEAYEKHLDENTPF